MNRYLTYAKILAIIGIVLIISGVFLVNIMDGISTILIFSGFLFLFTSRKLRS